MMLDDAATTRNTTATTKNDDGDGDGEEDEQWTTIEYDKCILIRMIFCHPETGLSVYANAVANANLRFRLLRSRAARQVLYSVLRCSGIIGDASPVASRANAAP